MWYRLRSSSGLTLFEVLFAALIASLTLAAILSSYIGNILLSDITNSRVIRQVEINNVIDNIRQQGRTNFEGLLAKANANTVEAPTIVPGQSEVMVAYRRPIPTNNNLVEVTLAPMWREARNRVIGEDQNLNGAVTGAEDTNLNGRPDSPYAVTVYVARHLED